MKMLLELLSMKDQLQYKELAHETELFGRMGIFFFFDNSNLRFWFYVFKLMLHCRSLLLFPPPAM